MHRPTPRVARLGPFLAAWFVLAAGAPALALEDHLPDEAAALAAAAAEEAFFEGNALMDQARLADAIVAYRRAVALDAAFHRARIRLAEALDAAGLRDQALRQVEWVLGAPGVPAPELEKALGLAESWRQPPAPPASPAPVGPAVPHVVEPAAAVSAAPPRRSRARPSDVVGGVLGAAGGVALGIGVGHLAAGYQGQVAAAEAHEPFEWDYSYAIQQRGIAPAVVGGALLATGVVTAVVGRIRAARIAGRGGPPPAWSVGPHGAALHLEF